MYCVHAQKRASGAPEHTSEHVKTQFPGAMPPDPPHTIHFVGSHFLYLPWAPPILSVALNTLMAMHALFSRR